MKKRILSLQKTISSIILLAVLLVGASPAITSCTSEEDKKQEQMLLLLWWVLQKDLPDYWAKLYYIHPQAAADDDNISYITEATSPSQSNQGKPKIVLVSGWDTDDRNDASFPSTEDLRYRALHTNWAHFVGTTEYNELLGDGYEIYTFDYLTSDGVDKNGARFRAALDAVFGDISTQEVIIYAHSMGGIVTRFAMYEGEAAPAYVKGAILNGSPLHGSSWASPEFQNSLGPIYSQLSIFLTDTEGGSDLRWDNFDGSLDGASNDKLEALNSKTDRDSLFHLTYGTPAESGSTTFTNTNPDSLGNIMRTACDDLNAYAPHDCLVPVSSASLQENTPASTQDLGDYEHFEINMKIAAVRQALRTKINGL